MASRPPSPDLEHAIYREMLERHIDGDLPVDERMKLFEHLESCEECSRILEAEERLIDHLSRLPRLTAPSSLRADLINKLEQERADSLLAHEDERFADALQGPSAETEPILLFAGRRPNPLGRHVSHWRRYSPIAATLFLVIAAMSALLTADFTSIPPAANLQRAAWAMIGSARAGVADRKNDSSQQPPTDGPAQALATDTASSTTTIVTASADPLPLPAESSKPMLAIVLKPTNGEAESGLEEDEVGRAVCDSAETNLAGELVQQDQFVLEGHRYRCYTLDVADGYVSALVDQLGQYRVPVDGLALQALLDQQRKDVDVEQVAFFSAPVDKLRSAVESLTYFEPASVQGRQLHVFVVD